MAWQSSTINPATTSPAGDISKITNDLQQLRSVLGGGTDAAIPNASALKDVAQAFTKAQRGAIVPLTDGATITPDFSLANNYSVTLGGNRTLANPTNIVAGQSGSIFITQDGTGSRTLAYGSYFKFAGGATAAPILTTTAGAIDRLDYVVKSATEIHAAMSKAVA